MKPFPALRWILLFSLVFVLGEVIYSQTVEDEIIKVREAIGNSTNTDQRQALEDYLKILEINAASGKRKTSPAITSDVRVDESISKRDLGAFLNAVKDKAPLMPSHLVKVVTDYQRVCHTPNDPDYSLRKKVLLRMGRCSSGAGSS